MKKNGLTSDFAASFSMWEKASAQTRGGTGRRPRSAEIKRTEGD